MRNEFSESSDLLERGFAIRGRELFEGRNDIVQDIPDDLSMDMGWELENALQKADTVQDIPDDLSEEEARQELSGDMLEHKTNIDLNEALSDFQSDVWEGLSDAEKKEAIGRLGEYAADELGLENPPKIEFYREDNPGDFGAFSEAENTIYINELNMSDPVETADTITHETRHCWQHERAMHPKTEQDYAFKDNFENYITPDMDFEAYQDQIVEADAREYADQFRHMIH